MIELKSQSLDNYLAGYRIAGLSTVFSYGITYIMFHRDQTPSKKAMWSIVFYAVSCPDFWICNDGSSLNRVPREKFIDFVLSNSTEEAEWLLFHVADIDSGKIAKS